jgi:DNA ligase-1
VESLKNVNFSFLEIAPKQICKNMDHMQQFLQDIIDEGGEGIILRDPLAPHQSGRSSGFLKHKVCLQQSKYLIHDLFFRNTEMQKQNLSNKLVRMNGNVCCMSFFHLFCE